MKKATILLFLFAEAVCFSQNVAPVVSLQEKQNSITINPDSEYRLSLYESFYKEWSLHLSGKVSPDYDIFGNELKTNVFTTFGVDF